MEEWKPVIGSWNDDENYDIALPAWRLVLELASKYRDTSEVREVMSWLVKRKISNDKRLTYIAAYHLLKDTDWLEKELEKLLLCDDFRFIKELFGSKENMSLDEYTKKVLEMTNVHEQIIKEYENRNIRKGI